MDSRHSQEGFVSFRASGISHVLAKPHTCFISLGLKRPYCEADHSLPSTDTCMELYIHYLIYLHVTHKGQMCF